MILDGGVCVCACLFAAPCVRAHNYCDADRASACTRIAHMERVARVVVPCQAGDHEHKSCVIIYLWYAIISVGA